MEERKFNISIVIQNMIHLVFLPLSPSSSNKTDMFALPHCDLPCKYCCQLSLSTFAFSHPSHMWPSAITGTLRRLWTSYGCTCIQLQERKGAKEKQSVHSKHTVYSPPGWTSRHNVQLEEVSANTGRHWEKEKIEPVKAWTGGYQWQNHLWKELLPFDREKMKGEDKKWLLIDGCFICLNPDDQTMQSYLVQKGAKVLMGFQSTLFSFVQFISTQFGLRD